MTDDAAVSAALNALAREEHRLVERQIDGTATDRDRRRIAEIDVELDRCWDLLRQRRARRRAGQDPDLATLRDAMTVEHYRQ